MNKSKFVDFINKYHLNGGVNSVTIGVSGNTIQTRFISEDRTMVGNVEMTSEELGDIGDEKLHIYRTDALLKLMSALNDDVQMNFLKNGNEVASVNMEDSAKTKVTFMMASPDAIPKVPSSTGDPEFQCVMELNNEFYSTFIKSRNAIPEAKNFAISSTDSEVTVTINYTNTSADNVKFIRNVMGNEEMKAIPFNVDHFKEIITANRGIDGEISVSSAGLAKIVFKDEEFTNVYYLIALAS